MTLSEFVDLFDNSGLKIAFDHFKTAQALPYLVYIVANNNQFAADDSVYHSDPEIQLELYTELKSETTETTVETILNTVPFFYTKEEGYLADEQMYMVTYRFTL